MRIEKYEKIGVDKYRIYLDNGEVIDTFEEVITKNELLLKKDLSSPQYEKLLIDTNLQSYYNMALKYISVRVRSTKEIRDYFKKKGVTDEDANYVISKLVANGFLDDSYFCKCFINDKLKFTTMGKYRIIKELKRQEIKAEIIDSYLELMNDEVMISKIEKLTDKYINANHKLDNKKLKNKIYNNLLNLGYSSDLILKVLNEKF